MAATTRLNPPSRRPTMARVRAFFADEPKYILFIALVCLALGLPFVQDVFRNQLDFLPAPTANALIVMTYYAVLALGLNIVVGFAGLLDLGYVAFFVFGAYTTAFLASPIPWGIHLPWWIVVFIAVGVAAIWGILLGAPTLKLRGDYLAIVTLGFGEIVPAVVRNLDNVHVQVLGVDILGPAFNLTGGPIGINPIDPPVIPFFGLFGIGDLIFSNNSPILSLILALGILLLVFFVTRRLRDSRLGRAWMAVREDETAAEAMGINTVSTKLLAFALGASFSGFVGAFVGAYQTAIFPETFKFSISILILIMVILGGMGSIRGAVLGAFVIMYANQTLFPYLGSIFNDPINDIGRSLDIDLLANFNFASYNFLIFGTLLVVMMIVRPEGLLPAAARRAELHGEGIAAEGTFGTKDSVAEAATEFEAHAGGLKDQPDDAWPDGPTGASAGGEPPPAEAPPPTETPPPATPADEEDVR
jgi:branched-chain amino acid transport system permease protein